MHVIYLSALRNISAAQAIPIMPTMDREPDLLCWMIWHVQAMRTEYSLVEFLSSSVFPITVVMMMMLQ